MIESARLAEAIGRIGPLDAAAMEAAAARLDRLTKPPGSLGRLEEIAVRLAGITGAPDPATRPRSIVVAAADHGVASRGVSAYPAAVTAQMVASFIAGGAAISVLARRIEASLVVVDAGVATPLPPPVQPTAAGVRFRSLGRGRGTDDLSVGPAMSGTEALGAIVAGLDLATEEIEAGAVLIGVGEMGIGNTTSASALTSVLTGAPVEAVTGRGTGLDDAGLRRKVAIVEQACGVNRADPREPLGVLAALGGFEIAVLVGVILGAAAARVPVVLDGFITGSAALVAAALSPALPPRLMAGHLSAEPGHVVVLDHLGLVPLLALDLRLGEGTGAALAIGLLDAAVALRDGMSTFEGAGVAGPHSGPADRT